MVGAVPLEAAVGADYLAVLFVHFCVAYGAQNLFLRLGHRICF